MRDIDYRLSGNWMRHSWPLLTSQIIRHHSPFLHGVEETSHLWLQSPLPLHISPPELLHRDVIPAVLDLLTEVAWKNRGALGWVRGLRRIVLFILYSNYFFAGHKLFDFESNVFARCRPLNLLVMHMLSIRLSCSTGTCSPWPLAFLIWNVRLQPNCSVGTWSPRRWFCPPSAMEAVENPGKKTVFVLSCSGGTWSPWPLNWPTLGFPLSTNRCVGIQSPRDSDFQSGGLECSQIPKRKLLKLKYQLAHWDMTTVGFIWIYHSVC